MQTKPLLAALLAMGILPAIAQADEAVRYNRDVRPILAAKCFTCHGQDKRARKAELRLDVRKSALAVIKPGEPESSELIARISHADADSVMPPPATGNRITKAEAAVLRRWIRRGARYEKHWAFLPPERPAIPSTRSRKRMENPIDAFVRTRLERVGLRPSPPADRATLIRRVTLDLTGLPATPTETAAFLADPSPNAYGKVVDRLLASPRYGEHAAAFWLDAARYADTDGYQNDRYRYMSPWRDWVVTAFNENKPYDAFVIEQLAGDMLPNATLKQQIATGFCRNHRINSEDGSIPAEWHVENVVDRVDTLGTVFLGLTVGCARCHEHKFDPISQQDYYRLFAYFNNVPEWGVGPNNGNSPPFVTVPKSWPNLSPAEDRAIAPEPVKLRRARKTAGNGLKRPQAGGPTTTMVMHEMAEPRPTYLLRRGQYNMPDKHQRLHPGVPASLNPFGGAPKDRLELARWLVHPRHPLTARVAVNRYWQQLFGVGLVKTSENLGTQGELPSHPQLLDWLAVEFLRSGWDVKAIRRLIVTSATYCQSSRASGRRHPADPENRLLSRGPRYRLPAFVLRDQALAISGLLVERIGGPSAKPYMPPRIWRAISNNRYVQDHGPNLYRRSVYTYWRRTIPPPTMSNFNSAGREVCAVRTERTNTPLQALTLLNNVTFVEASRFLAERMLRDGGRSASERLTHGFQLATGRAPAERELSLLLRAYASFRKTYESDRTAARQLLAVGEGRRDRSLDLAEHAAMTMAASLILNLDETITKE
ncbi:MAG: PSD1 and planctomycete cytochrome C domain-containing protein [Planctomycetaceae bacterium]